MDFNSSEDDKSINPLSHFSGSVLGAISSKKSQRREAAVKQSIAFSLGDFKQFVSPETLPQLK